MTGSEAAERREYPKNRITEIQSRGFPPAFLVPLSDGRRSPVESFLHTLHNFLHVTDEKPLCAILEGLAVIRKPRGSGN